MNFKNIKLVAADMDGTLLDSKHELNPEFYPIFRQMKEKGVNLAIASGRQLYNMQNFFKDIKDDLIFIAENGSYTTWRDDVILLKPMDPQRAKEQIQFARQIPAAYIVLCGRESAYIEDTHEPFMSKMKLYYDRYEVVDDLMRIEDDEFLKIAICDLKGAEKNSYPRFDKQDSGLKISVSGEVWLDIYDKHASKGAAIMALQQRLRISKNETLAIGDYLNDLDMMDHAYFSYAMGNAHPDLIRAARFTTAGNDEDGALDVFRKIVQDN